MKNIVLAVLALLMIISISIAVLANIVGIGYGLYLWGSVGLPFGAAVWQAFVLWIAMLGGGAVIAGFSFGMAKVLDEA